MHFSPIRSSILWSQQLMTNKLHPLHNSTLGHNSRVFLEIAERMTRKYEKLEFGIEKTEIDGKEYYLFEEIVNRKPFCNLVQFNKVDYDESQQQKLLIVAPLAGHHATLLRSTVEEFLPNFDVYITDWINPCLVHTKHGEFDLDDYIDYIIDFLGFLGPHVNVLAVCQPVVPVLAATAILSSYKNQDNVPKTMILMGGPVDARISPTKVNDFATSRSLKWFEDNVISIVPHNYPGAMRKVYPGFLQLAGFLAINWRTSMLK